MNLAASKTKIVVKKGTYTNNNYGSGDSNGAVMNIKSKTDILITNKQGHSPLVKFDGSGGIVMSNVKIIIHCNVFITFNKQFSGFQD